MLTYNELIQLRNKLGNGEIQLEIAKAQFWVDFKEGQRSWNTKDWQERRSKFLKDKCEICCGTETLTIQHLSHPRKYSEYLREITRKYAKDHIDTNPEIIKARWRLSRDKENPLTSKHINRNTLCYWLHSIL